MVDIAKRQISFSRSLVTVFLENGRQGLVDGYQRKIDRLMPIVAETEQIADRRNSPLNSRPQISDGSVRRFFVAC